MAGFERPWILLLLPLLALAIWWVRGSGSTALIHSRAAVAGAFSDGWSGMLARLPDVLRALVAFLLILAAAGPRTGAAAVETDAEGIAIVIAVDISSSMLAEDFAPDNRLAVARRQVAEFIRGREHDRIGLVAFAGEALTQVPITLDYSVLHRAIEQLDVGNLEDGTAIGTAVATAANRLRRVPGESRVIILMTDGENNRGEIDPLTAARAAEAYGIRVYTIGVGSHGIAPMPVARDLFGGYRYANVPVSIDEDLLREISDLTGGRYFRATNPEALDSIYHRIDELERSSVEVKRYVDYTPRHLPFILLGAFLLVGEWGLRASRWGRVP